MKGALLVTSRVAARLAPADALEAEGFRVHCCGDAGAACETLDREAVDHPGDGRRARGRRAGPRGRGGARLAEAVPELLLRDVQISGGGGEALLRAIRADAALAGVAVVVVTAYAMAGDRERLLGAGFDGRLSKPSSPVLS